MAEYVFTLRNVRKAHGDKVVLDNVTLSFLHGAKIGVVGPNGAGKSSVLKIMAGIDQAVIGPGLRDQSVERHAARTAGKPIVARARGPSSIAAPAARTWSSVTASIRATISPGSNRRP